MEEDGSSSRPAKRARTWRPNNDPAADVAAGPPQVAFPGVIGLASLAVEEGGQPPSQVAPRPYFHDGGYSEFWRRLLDAEVEPDTRFLRFSAPNPLLALSGWGPSTCASVTSGCMILCARCGERTSTLPAAPSDKACM